MSIAKALFPTGRASGCHTKAKKTERIIRSVLNTVEITSQAQ